MYIIKSIWKGENFVDKPALLGDNLVLLSGSETKTPPCFRLFFRGLCTCTGAASSRIISR